MTHRRRARTWGAGVARAWGVGAARTWGVGVGILVLAVALAAGAHLLSRPPGPSFASAPGVVGSPSAHRAPSAPATGIPAPVTRSPASGVGNPAPDAVECARSGRRSLTPAALAAEDTRPGDRTWQRIGLGHSRILAHLDRTSYACGDVADLHVSGPGPTAQATVVRFGSYGGAGSRVVRTVPAFPIAPRTLPGPRGRSRLMSVHWPVSVRIPIPPSWPPGLYGVIVGDGTGGPLSLAPFTLRAPAGATPLLVVSSDLTWSAYNRAGGVSLYHGGGRNKAVDWAGRAREVSLARPLVGSGLNHFLTMERPLAQILARHAIPAAWVTDTDVDAAPAQLLGHAGIVIPGHSEYWTRAMYDGATRARDAGVNFAFLGANQIHWQARVTRHADGTPATMIVYRDDTDPLAASRPALQTTRWADPPLDRGSIALTGQLFSTGGAWGPMRVMRDTSWVFAGTGLTTGDLLVNAGGNEADSARPGPPRPGDPVVEVLLQGVYDRGGYIDERTFSTTYYSHRGGAGVFSAGTTYWPCVAARSCPDLPVPRETSAAVDTMTMNVLTAFARPRAGATHRAAPSPLMPAGAFRTLVGPGGIAHATPPG